MIAVGLFIVMVGFAHPISVLMQAPKEAVELTSVYVRICGGGIFFIVAYNLYQQFSVDWGTVNHRCYLYLLHVL